MNSVDCLLRLVLAASVLHVREQKCLSDSFHVNLKTSRLWDVHVV